jgi:hypothetical protein
MKLNNKQVSAVLSAAKAIATSMNTFAETLCDVFGEATTEELPLLAEQLVGIMDFVSMPTIVTSLHEYGFESDSIRIFIKAIAAIKGYSKSAVSQAMSIARDPDAETKGGAPTQGIVALTIKHLAKAKADKKLNKAQAKAIVAALNDMFNL